MAVTSTPVPLDLIAGLPYNRRIRVVGVTTIWPSLDVFEVRSQIRVGRTTDTLLLADFAPYLVPSIDGADIVIDIQMTGEDTRNLSKLAPRGYYDIILSDIGTVDAHAIPVISGKIKFGGTVTEAADV